MMTEREKEDLLKSMRKMAEVNIWKDTLVGELGRVGMRWEALGEDDKSKLELMGHELGIRVADCYTEEATEKTTNVCKRGITSEFAGRITGRVSRTNIWKEKEIGESPKGRIETALQLTISKVEMPSLGESPSFDEVKKRHEWWLESLRTAIEEGRIEGFVGFTD